MKLREPQAESRPAINPDTSSPARWGTFLVLSALFFMSGIMLAFAQNTVVTYQGRVTSHGTNFTGNGQFKFALVTVTNTAADATATAELTGQFVTSVTVTSGGSGYVTPPAVTFSGGGGSGAAAHAVLAGGVVTSVVVDSTGSGYTSPPAVTIASPPDTLSFTTFWSNDDTSFNGSEPTDAVMVTVDNGLFTVRLGDETLPNMIALTAGLFLQSDLHLRLWFSDGVSGFAVLSPTQPLTATPYAMTALVMDAGRLTGTISPNRIDTGAITSAKLDPGIGLWTRSTNDVYRPSGNVGIGVSVPTSKLDVRGDIRLGTSGQFLAPGGVENLRIIRGIVNGAGTVLEGTGFTITKGAAGFYTITFTPAFADLPAVVVSPQSGLDRIATCTSITASSTGIFTRDSAGTAVDNQFNFIAIGPR
jgi:hypothetical protein